MEQKKVKYRFKEGEAVCHIDNLELKMNIERVVFVLYDTPDQKDPSKKNTTKKILGIKVHWFESNKLHKAQFHKHLLVPYEVVVKSKSFVDIQQWMKENNS